jgi:hypothetical protein
MRCSSKGRFQPAPIVAAHQFAFEGPKRDPLEMVKMKVDPAMCMKTQAMVTKCHAKNTAFYTKMHELHHIDNNRADFLY